MVELATVRREWILTGAAGDSVATVTDDRVTGRTLDTHAGTTSATTWAEIEVELAEHGTVEVLDRIEHALLAAPRRGRSWAGCSPTGCRRPRRGRGPGPTPPPGMRCWHTRGSRPTRSARPTPGVRQDAPTPCTTCAWHVG